MIPPWEDHFRKITKKNFFQWCQISSRWLGNNKNKMKGIKDSWELKQIYTAHILQQLYFFVLKICTVLWKYVGFTKISRSSGKGLLEKNIIFVVTWKYFHARVFKMVIRWTLKSINYVLKIQFVSQINETMLCYLFMTQA